MEILAAALGAQPDNFSILIITFEFSFFHEQRFQKCYVFLGNVDNWIISHRFSEFIVEFLEKTVYDRDT